jgi:hypothetical protein
MQVADGLLDSLICIEIDRSCFEIELELAFENVTHFRHFLSLKRRKTVLSTSTESFDRRVNGNSSA